MPTDSGSATYLEAVGLALDSEMDRDPDVFIIGEDVGQFGGAFKVTKGFLDKFGPRRVVDTPIAETGFTGLAAGAALVGLYSAGMCSVEEAKDVETRFADRMKSIEGGPLELKQTVEAVRLCAAQKDARRTDPPRVALPSGTKKDGAPAGSQ